VAKALIQAAIEVKTVPKFKNALNLACLTGESHWQHCERLPQATAYMCVSQLWTFWAFNV